MMAYLMPYIEQTAFAARYDFTKNYNQAPNTAIITTRFPIFDCPSDTILAAGHPNLGDLKGNYGVNWGSWSFRQQGGPVNGVFPLNYGDKKGRAPFYIDITVKLTDIADGTSNTALFSEIKRTVDDVAADDAGNALIMQGTGGSIDPLDPSTVPQCTGQVSGGSKFRYVGLQYWRGAVSWTSMYNHTLTPNSPIRGACVDGTLLSFHLAARSYHTGGVNVALGDGSVRFVRDSIPLATWRALGTIAGGEVIDAAAY
jgi:prepilin-type processing-associated H-X9-DG protein